MADFDLEQLRVLFQNLADKLANTRGDEATVEQLIQVEATLKKLSKSIGAQSSDQEKKKEAREFIKEFFDKWTELNPLKGLNESRSRNPEYKLNIDLDDDTSKRARSDLSNSLGSATRSLNGFVGGLISGLNRIDGSVTSLVATFGISSGAAYGITKFLDDEIDAYRMLQNSAEGTVGSLQDMRRSASEASLTSLELAKALQDGTEGARLFGAANWAQTFKGIKQTTESMGYYGYTLEQLGNAQSSFLDMLRDSGNLFDLDQSQIVSGLDALLNVNDKMATILGKTRDDMLRDLDRRNIEPNFQMWLRGQGFSDQEQTNIQAYMSGLDQKSKEAAMDYMMSGTFSQATAGTLLSQDPTAQAILERVDLIREGQRDFDPAAELENLGKVAREFSDRNRDVSTMAILGRIGNVEVAQAQSERLAHLMRIGEVDEKPSYGPEQRDPATVGLLNLQDVTKQLQMAFQDLISQVLIPLLNDYGPQIKDGVIAIKDFITSLREGIKGLSSFESALSLAGIAIGGILGLSVLKSFLFGLVGKIFVPMLGNILKGSIGGLGTVVGNSITGILGAFLRKIPLIAAGAAVVEGSTSRNELEETYGKENVGVGDQVSYGIASLLDYLDEFQGLITGADLIDRMDVVDKFRRFDNWTYRNLGSWASGNEGNLTSVSNKSTIEPSNKIEGNIPDNINVDIPNNIEGVIPDNINVDIPNNIEGVIPDNINVDIPNNIEGVIPDNIDVDIPNSIEGVIPDNINVDIPNNIEGVIPDNINVDIPNNIEGVIPDNINVDIPNNLEIQVPKIHPDGILTNIVDIELPLLSLTPDQISIKEPTYIEILNAKINSPVIDIADILLPSSIVQPPKIEIPTITVKKPTEVPDMIIPEVQIPKVSIPDISVDQNEIKIPNINIPDVTVSESDIQKPVVSIPNINLPEINIPDINIDNIPNPDITVPDITVDASDIQTPNITIPDVNINSNEIPHPIFSVPDVEVPTSDIEYPVFNTPIIDLPKIPLSKFIYNVPEITLPKVSLPDINIPLNDIDTSNIKIEPSILTPDISLPTIDLEDTEIDEPKIISPVLDFSQIDVKPLLNIPTHFNNNLDETVSPFLEYQQNLDKTIKGLEAYVMTRNISFDKIQPAFSIEVPIEQIEKEDTSSKKIVSFDKDNITQIDKMEDHFTSQLEKSNVILDRILEQMKSSNNSSNNSINITKEGFNELIRLNQELARIIKSSQLV